MEKLKWKYLIMIIIGFSILGGVAEWVKLTRISKNLFRDAGELAYTMCRQDGTGTTFCRCMQAEMEQNLKNEIMAADFIQGRHTQDLQLFVMGARLRCECRVNPERVASYGLPCDDLPPLNF